MKMQKNIYKISKKFPKNKGIISPLALKFLSKFYYFCVEVTNLEALFYDLYKSI